MQQTATAAPDYAAQLQELKREYFPPSDLEKAQEKVGVAIQIATANNITPVYNFDTEADFPEGYGLAILPIKERDEQRGNVVRGLCVAAMPDPATVAAHDKGESFIRDAVVGTFLSKLANSVRPRSDGTTAASVPYTVEDFITSARAAESLAAFRELAPQYVKALKKKGLSIITSPILRQVLSSAQFAEQQFPHIDGAKWDGVLDKMITKAKEKGLDSGIMDHWKSTRAEVEISMGDFDLDGLDGLMDD
jgi:hypothetical protein